MNHSEAENLLKKHVAGETLLKHCISTEAIMREVAGFLGEDKEAWGLCGLLHDIDFEKTKENPVQHGVAAKEMLKESGVSEEIVRAIEAHNYVNPGAAKRTTKMDHMLVAADAMTGLIIASAMVKGKKLENVTEDTVKDSFKKKGFAQGSRRDMIMECELAGIPYDKFVELSLKAMKGISERLGL